MESNKIPAGFFKESNPHLMFPALASVFFTISTIWEAHIQYKTWTLFFFTFKIFF